jgi:nucleoside 2-deoxyribosyltransferase
MKVFIVHSMKDSDLVANVEEHLRDSGYDVTSPGSLPSQVDILSAISASIRSADVLLAFVTSTNADTYYELGLAAGANVPMLIVAKAGEPLPLGLSSVPFVQLTGDSLRDAQTIVRRVEDLKGLVASPADELGSGEKALRAAVRDPRVLESIPPIEFERFVAEFFRERGLRVTQTPRFAADLVVETQGGKETVLVELKKMSRESRVSVEAVRRFLNVVTLFGASSGVLVSTSGFTSAAMALAAGTPIVLRTLEELLAAKSNRELFSKQDKSNIERSL